MHYVAPLIAEAWEQHHRRRNRLILAAMIAGLFAVLTGWALGALGTMSGGGGHRAPGVTTVRSSSVLSRTPYMGIAVCHPASSRCYRVGLAVWLKQPAVSVTATIGSLHFSLPRSDRRGVQMVAKVRRREFIGFVSPRGVVPGAYPRTPDATPYVPVAVVTLTINRAHNRTFTTRLRVPVQAGWG